MSQFLTIEDYITQTQKYREYYFPQNTYSQPSLGRFLAMPYNQQILTVNEKLQQTPPSDELVSDYLAWVPREQRIIDNYNDKNTPFKRGWYPPGGTIDQFETYTVATISDSVKIITVGMQEAFLSGNHMVGGYIESVDDQKRWGYILYTVDYDDNAQSVGEFLKKAVASITDQEGSYTGYIKGTAVSQDQSNVAFLRKGTCRAVLLRTFDYIHVLTSDITGYRHNYSMIDSANFDMGHRYSGA